MTLYEVLGIEKTASEDDIKKKFRKMALELHPDRHPDDPKAEEKFKEISNAYTILSDSESRRKYDASLSGGNSAGNPGNIWADIFNNFHSRPRNSGPTDNTIYDLPGQNVEIKTIISMADSYHGATKTVKVPDICDCSSCSGSGSSGGRMVMCHFCNGSGVNVDLFHGIQRKCQACRGRKQLPMVACVSCRGTGITTKEKDQSIQIPKGIPDQSTLRIPGAGTRGYPHGDLFIYVSVSPEDGVIRSGLEVRNRILVPFDIMINGGVVHGLTKYGSDYHLNVSAGSQSGTVISKDGEGFPDPNNPAYRGRAHYEIYPEIPYNLTHKARALLINFLDELKSPRQTDGSASSA
jgi:molecular chaperone DnaJ